MARCRNCGNAIELRFRFCPWCAEPQRLKLVEFFAPHPGVPQDALKALRVSRYFETEETPPQFRISIWSDDSADAAISLTDAEAARLAGFVSPAAPRRHRRLDQLRESLRQL